jgi:hypothetical protein
MCMHARTHTRLLTILLTRISIFCRYRHLLCSALGGIQDFYQKNMKKIQAKLAECADKQSMSIESLERLSNALHTAPAPTPPTPEDDDVMDENNTSTTSPLSDELIAAKEFKGENIGVKLGTNKKSKKRKAKHAVRKSTINVNNNGKEQFVRAKGKQKPRYHVEF